ncbi:MAG TPA: hypothetical protein DCR28_03455 [Eubacterium sp.]|nr:hypothetical protein [Eubacterium sp.]
MTELEFEWDDKKEAANIKKHKLNFKIARVAFYDFDRIEYYDKENSIEEDRYVVIGKGIGSELLFIVYTVRDGKYRLISARQASKREEKIYYGKNDN